ncbi:MAG: sigma-54-dependent Fis family transcriptional regulator [Proteobacteria bacterium]|nr:sigma-54-dependent Fis family transcriptional regulator [Pseudomonadota bacterium]
MRLLIVGSLGGEMAMASKIALQHGARVGHADTIETALNSLRAGPGADLIMIDVTLDIGKMVGLLESERFNVPVVACGIDTDKQTAVRAIQAGAREFIPLPPDADLIAAVLEAVVEESHAIIFADPSIGAVLDLAKQVARSQANILITGPSGTGKELVARYVHHHSKRAAKPLVSINCAAIPENLLESELFGHEKGAFTGAVARRIGKFEEADGGSLLLDEISEMAPRLQAKLLRAIQEREIDRVGGTSPVKIDIRIISTSNRDLEAEIAAGNFRDDLYFRLNVVNLRLSPLCERPLDVPLLCEHFAAKYADVNGIVRRRLSPQSIELLANYSWPGNVRELENVMHRAVLLANGDEITPEALQLGGGTARAAASTAGGAVAAEAAVKAAEGLVGHTVAEVERDLILETLNHCLGNRTHAANILGISIRTLRNKLRQYADEGAKVPFPGELQRAAV